MVFYPWKNYFIRVEIAALGNINLCFIYSIYSLAYIIIDLYCCAISIYFAVIYWIVLQFTIIVWVE